MLDLRPLLGPFFVSVLSIYYWLKMMSKIVVTDKLLDGQIFKFKIMFPLSIEMYYFICCEIEDASGSSIQF